MINKYTLKFYNIAQEQAYLESQSSKIIQELFNLSLYCIGYCLISFFEFILTNTYIYSGISIIVLVGTILSYYFLKTRIQYIDYALIFYQFFIAAVFKLDNFINPEQQVNTQFSWYFGFQCCIAHYSLYLQGSSLIISSATLFFIFLIHLYGSEIYSINGIFNIVKLVFVFTIMLSVKYTIIKMNKYQFLQNLERQELYELLQTQSSTLSLQIRLNQKEDQLHLVWVSKQGVEKYQIVDSKSMRAFIRQIQYKGKNNVEQQIRRLLYKNDILGHQTINEGVQLGKNILQMKLIVNYNNNHLSCLVILMPEGKKQSQNWNQHLLKFVSQTFRNWLNHISKQNQVKMEDRASNQLLQVNTSLNLIQLIEQKLPNKITTITQQYITSCISDLFNNRVSIIWKIRNFKQHFQLIMQLILSCYQLIHQFNAQQSQQFYILFENSHCEGIIILKLYFKNNLESHIPIESLFSYVSQNRIRKVNNTIKEVMGLINKYQLPYNVSINLMAIKHILQNISPNNKGKVLLIDEKYCLRFEIYNLKFN